MSSCGERPALRRLRRVGCYRAASIRVSTASACLGGNGSANVASSVASVASSGSVPQRRFTRLLQVPNDYCWRRAIGPVVSALDAMTNQEGRWM